MTVRDGIRVVLADDHPVVREGLAAIINQQPDMKVIAEIGDGEAALESYRALQPDVMMLDLRMPKLDGVTVVERLMADYPTAQLLIVTTYDNDEDILRSLNGGALGYVLKDAPRSEILAAVRAVSEGRRFTSKGIAMKALEHFRRPVLTQRELEVLGHLCRGLSNKDIARHLDITEETAKSHVKSILLKLDAMSRTEAVAIAFKRGLVKLETY